MFKKNKDGVADEVCHLIHIDSDSQYKPGSPLLSCGVGVRERHFDFPQLTRTSTYAHVYNHTYINTLQIWANAAFERHRYANASKALGDTLRKVCQILKFFGRNMGGGARFRNDDRHQRISTKDCGSSPLCIKYFGLYSCGNQSKRGCFSTR